MRVLIRGAGVAGLVTAYELARAGFEVEVSEIGAAVASGASWFAGGMLAPWCERESVGEAVLSLGAMAADWWSEVLPGHVARNGTLVVASPRDASELQRFAARTSGYTWLDADGVDACEPALAGRFQKGLFFADEAHLDPRAALTALHEKLTALGVCFRFNAAADERPGGFGRVVDCTGSNRIGKTGKLRGVRGEMLYLRSHDVVLSRPVRLLHPRIPLYIVPRGSGLFMVGATMIESEEAGPVTARSLMELLNAAYTVHPAFGEAQVVETASGIRPAFPDNMPCLVEEDGCIFVNGFYRHGFLLAPALAQQVVCLITPDTARPIRPAATRGYAASIAEGISP